MTKFLAKETNTTYKYKLYHPTEPYYLNIDFYNDKEHELWKPVIELYEKVVAEYKGSVS